MSQTTVEFMKARGFTLMHFGDVVDGTSEMNWVDKWPQDGYELTEDEASLMHQLYIQGQIDALRHINRPSMLGIEVIKREIAALTRELEELKKGSV